MGEGVRCETFVRIARSKFIQNKKAIRIAAHLNHDVMKLDRELSPIAPSKHIIQNNEIRNNVIGIELKNAIDTQMNQKILDNLVANVTKNNVQDMSLIFK